MTQFSEVLPEGVPDRALLAAIVEGTDDAIVSVDGGGRITSWNRGAEDLYRRRAADAVGRPMGLRGFPRPVGAAPGGGRDGRAPGAP